MALILRICGAPLLSTVANANTPTSSIFFIHVAKSILQLLSRDLVSRLPALGIRTVEVSGSAVCHGGASPAPCFQFTFAAFLEFIVISVFFHLADPDVRQPVFPDIRHSAVGDSAARLISPLEEMVIWQLPQLQPP